MIKDLREPGKYGISNVVGDLHSAEVPTAINRTLLEYQQLRQVFESLKIPRVYHAAEFGCGYGRMLPFLCEIADNVYGFERDRELAELAHKLNPHCGVFHFEGLETFSFGFELVLTYTFLQHLHLDEFNIMLLKIRNQLKIGGFLIAVEDYYTQKSFEPFFKLLWKGDRVREATHPTTHVGSVMVFTHE